MFLNVPVYFFSFIINVGVELIPYLLCAFILLLRTFFQNLYFLHFLKSLSSKPSDLVIPFKLDFNSFKVFALFHFD